MNPDPIKDETPPAAAAPVPPSTAGMTTRVVKGSLWTLAGQVAPLGISLFTTPFVIRLLGSEGYGVLILVGLIPTYFAFADLGMGIASTKFASEAYAAGDAEREAATVNTAAAMSFVLSIPIAALIFIFSDAAVGLFNVPDHFRTEANIALKLAAVTFVINFLNGIFNTPQLTRLRMDLNTFVSSGFRMLGLVATPVTIYLGGGIIGAAAVLLAVSMLTLAANLFVSGKLLNELLKFKLDRTAARPMLKFGVACCASSIALIFLGHSEKLVLTANTSVTELAYYSAAFTLANMTTLLSASLMQSLMPAFATVVDDRGEGGQFQTLYLRSIKIVLLFIPPMIAVMVVVAKPFFSVWGGPDFGEYSTFPFYVLLFGLIWNLFSYVPYAGLVASGRTDLIARLHWAELIVYIAVMTVSVKVFGIVGAALAWSMRVLVDTLLQFKMAKNITGVRLDAKILFASLLSGIMVFALPVVLFLAGSTPLLIALLLLALVSPLYGWLMVKMVLDDDERRWLGSSIRRFTITN